MLEIKGLRTEGASWQPTLSKEPAEGGVFASLFEQVRGGHGAEKARGRGEQRGLSEIRQERRRQDEGMGLEREADLEPGMSEERAVGPERRQEASSAEVSSVEEASSGDEALVEVVDESGVVAAEGDREQGQAGEAEVGAGEAAGSVAGQVLSEAATVVVEQAAGAGESAQAASLSEQGSVGLSGVQLSSAGLGQEQSQAGEAAGTATTEQAVGASVVAGAEGALGQSERDETGEVIKAKPGQEQASAGQGSGKVELADAVRGVSEEPERQASEQDAKGGQGKEAQQLVELEKGMLSVSSEAGASGALSTAVPTGSEREGQSKPLEVVEALVAPASVGESGEALKDLTSAGRLERSAASDAALVRENVDAAVKAVKVAVARQGSSVQIRLNPPELGTLRIEMKQDAGGLRVQLQATSVQAQQLLEQGKEELQAALKLQGVPARHIEVQLRLDLRNDQSGGRGQEWGQDQQGRGGMGSQQEAGQEGSGQSGGEWSGLTEEFFGGGQAESDAVGVSAGESGVGAGRGQGWEALEFGRLDVQG